MFGIFGKKKPPAKKSREELLKEAKANAAAAREAIGEETLDKIREHMMKKENNPFEQAKKQIMAMDKERIVDNIRATYREED